MRGSRCRRSAVEHVAPAAMETGKKTRFAALAVITAAYAPLLWLHFRRLWANDEHRLTSRVQGIASHAGSSLLDFFAVNHLLSGNVLRIPSREFLVQDACGGIPSFFSPVALAAILVPQSAIVTTPEPDFR